MKPTEFTLAETDTLNLTRTKRDYKKLLLCMVMAFVQLAFMHIMVYDIIGDS